MTGYAGVGGWAGGCAGVRVTRGGRLSVGERVGGQAALGGRAVGFQDHRGAGRVGPADRLGQEHSGFDHFFAWMVIRTVRGDRQT